MTNIFSKLETRATGMCKPSEFDRKPVSVELECADTGTARPGAFVQDWEHELRLRLSTRFWCNQAQYSDALKHASRTIAHLLYDDVFVALDGIAHAISDGDRRAALERIAELRGALRITQ